VAEGGALLAGQLGRFVGVDEISVESEAEYESSLVIGKYLSPRLYVSYGVSLTDAINTFKLRYTIGDRWVITGESGQESSADVEYTIDR
jgi:translocation and assembly module TamB